MFRLLACLVAFLAVGIARADAPQDVRNSADHPLVGRFEGAVITHYLVKEFDDAQFLTGPPDKADARLPAEGKRTDLSYNAPLGRSSLEIFRNYQQRLASAGFTPLYSCEKDSCGNANLLVRAAFDEASVGRLGFAAGYRANPRFGSFRLSQGGREVFAALYVGDYGGAGQGPFINLRVVDVRAMETGKIVVPTAREMNESITRDGRIALYGIFFDTGQASLKPESKPTLDEIAVFLRSNPKATLLVVGHTDNVGDFQSNVSLSQRRAVAVSEALQKQFSVAAARLQPFGAGMSAPVASNGDEAGRARNRRVELVLR